MPRRSITTFLVALLLLTPLAACGNDEMSREEFIAAADEICGEIEQEAQDLRSPETEQEFAEFVEEGRRITLEGLERLRALDPPAEDEERVSRMLDRIEEAVGYLEDIQEAMEEEDFERMAEIGTRVQEASAEAQQIANEYGFQHCPGGRAEPVAPEDADE